MGKRSACRRTPFVAAVAFLIGPERQRPADDGTCGDGSEVTAVEAVSDLPIHEEDFADAGDTAALPDRQFAADPVALQRFAHLHAIDGDGVASAANPLAGPARPGARRGGQEGG